MYHEPITFYNHGMYVDVDLIEISEEDSSLFLHVSSYEEVMTFIEMMGVDFDT